MNKRIMASDLAPLREACDEALKRIDRAVVTPRPGVREGFEKLRDALAEGEAFLKSLLRVTPADEGFTIEVHDGGLDEHGAPVSHATPIAEEA